jgi:hypothetical protein
MQARAQVLGAAILVAGILAFVLPAGSREAVGCDKIAAAKMAAPAGCIDDGDCATGCACRAGKCVPIYMKTTAPAPAKAVAPAPAKGATAAPAGCIDDGDCATGCACRAGKCVPIY